MVFIKNLSVYICLVFALTAFVSCDKNQYEIEREMRLEGTWIFDKVTHHKSGLFNCSNITSQYSGHSIEFREDKTVLYNLPNGGVKKGIWELEYVDGGEEDDDIGILAISLTDQSTQSGEMHIWSDVCVRKRKLRANEDQKNGLLEYKLRKK